MDYPVGYVVRPVAEPCQVCLKPIQPGQLYAPKPCNLNGLPQPAPRHLGCFAEPK